MFLKQKRHHCLLLNLLMEHQQQVNLLNNCLFILFLVVVYYKTKHIIVEWVEAEKKPVDTKVKSEKRSLKVPNVPNAEKLK